jgi:hypothetical protein
MTGTRSAALTAVLTRAGIDPAREGEDLQEAVHRAIALRRYSCTWTKVSSGWVVTLEFPELHRFFGETLEDALGWCLAWVVDQEAGNASEHVVLGSARSDGYDGQLVRYRREQRH